jgi:hypothetical protein
MIDGATGPTRIEVERVEESAVNYYEHGRRADTPSGSPGDVAKLPRRARMRSTIAPHQSMP